MAMSPTPQIMIGTPAYGGMVHTDNVKSLLNMQRAGLVCTLMAIGNESLITRGRNSIMAAFAARPEFTHLLFLDADVQLAAEGLVRLLQHGKDVIGAPVALKALRPDGSRMFNVGKALGEDGPLFIVDRIGTAVLLLSRAAVTALVEDARAAGRVYARAATARGDFDAAIHYDVFQVGVIDNEYLSEDYWVCRRLRELGFEVHVDATVVTRHHGTQAF